MTICFLLKQQEHLFLCFENLDESLQPEDIVCHTIYWYECKFQLLYITQKTFREAIEYNWL